MAEEMRYELNPVEKGHFSDYKTHVGFLDLDLRHLKIRSKIDLLDESFQTMGKRNYDVKFIVPLINNLSLSRNTGENSINYNVTLPLKQLNTKIVYNREFRSNIIGAKRSFENNILGFNSVLKFGPELHYELSGLTQFRMLFDFKARHRMFMLKISDVGLNIWDGKEFLSGGNIPSRLLINCFFGPILFAHQTHIRQTDDTIEACKFGAYVRDKLMTYGLTFDITKKIFNISSEIKFTKKLIPSFSISHNGSDFIYKFGLLGKHNGFTFRGIYSSDYNFRFHVGLKLNEKLYGDLLKKDT